MGLRVGDREREETADALREHAAAGRLEPDELEARTGSRLHAHARRPTSTG